MMMLDTPELRSCVCAPHNFGTRSAVQLGRHLPTCTGGLCSAARCRPARCGLDGPIKRPPPLPYRVIWPE